MKGRISSELEDLNRLSATYDWIPNENTIRPTPEDLATKRRVMAEIAASWPSVKDFVVSSIFNNSTEQWIFKPSNFRYNLPSHSNHYILWNTQYDYFSIFDDHIINQQIEIMIKNITGRQAISYAWYKNPKPTVLDFWHIQVFWT